MCLYMYIHADCFILTEPLSLPPSLLPSPSLSSLRPSLPSSLPLSFPLYLPVSLPLSFLSTLTSQRLALQESNISRYREEFKEVCVIGSGSFGTVYKCINRLGNSLPPSFLTHSLTHSHTHIHTLTHSKLAGNV